MSTSEIIIPAGRGAYDFSHDGARLYTCKNGRIYLIADLWCGVGVEGECYRRFIAPVSETEAKAFRANPQWIDCVDIAWTRVSRANAALQAIARAALRLEGAR